MRSFFIIFLFLFLLICLFFWLQSQYATTQFTEEFDFMAMNEKFKKDEVWGHLGKAKEIDKQQGAEDDATAHNLENAEGRDLIANQKVVLLNLLCFPVLQFCI